MMQAECHGLRGECFMKWLVRTASSLLFPLLIACSASAQAAFDCHFDQVPAVSGYEQPLIEELRDRKSTRLNSSHGYISYAVFCLKKKKILEPITANTCSVLQLHSSLSTFVSR